MPSVSRGSILRLIARGRVLVDGVRRPKGMRLAAAQRVVVAAAAADEKPVPQPDLPLEVIAERGDFVVVNKPAGHATHPLVPGETDTVANAVAARYPQCLAASPRPREGGLVHRLDWSTSGILVAALNPEGYGRLRGLFSSHRVNKEYLALVAGHVATPGIVELALESMPGDRRRVRVVSTDRGSDAGQSALTNFTPLVRGHHRGDDLTLVRVRCSTGRRHQVRVHLAHAGHPLAGDLLYHGPAIVGLDGALLHASAIELDGERFEAPLAGGRARFLREAGCDPGRVG